MSSKANIEKMAEGTFGACSGADWCPHAVQVALDPGKDGDAITSRNVIVAREVAATAAEGLSIRR